jgi:omega-6 fatty acid desaturase (delta-12 desaturase)
VNTLVPLALALGVAGSAGLALPVRLAASVLAGLLTVRGFIVYHDVLHGALFRGHRAWARLGRAFFSAYGVLVLTPPTVWRATHNYHHAHTAKLVGSHVGSYMMLTPALYARATPAQRWMYRLTRHPLNMLLGYLTIFGVGMCARPFVRAPRKHWDGALALVVHAALLAALVRGAGWGTAALVLVLPLAVACASGAYLFYAQHNFPGIEVQPRETWSYTRAALESSSFMRLGPVMNYFTGNIGYHHVHHLNPSIPFYRLPDAMAGVPELRSPRETTLRPRDVLACLRLKLWDPDRHEMVGYPDA